MMNLDAAKLKVILQEARDCFLYEDAPGYLADLEQGIQMLRPDAIPAQLHQQLDALMRAAHSLKGGAGIAELMLISNLAHKLEDGFQGLLDRHLMLDENLIALATVTTEQMQGLIVTATTQNGCFDRHDTEATEALIASWDELLATRFPAGVSNSDELGLDFLSASGVPAAMIQVVLETDLEDCLQRVEQLLGLNPEPAELRNALGEFGDECLLIGQALSQTWLVAIITEMQTILQDSQAPVLDLAQAILVEVRTRRAEILAVLNPAAMVIDHAASIATLEPAPSPDIFAVEPDPDLSLDAFLEQITELQPQTELSLEALLAEDPVPAANVDPAVLASLEALTTDPPALMVAPEPQVQFASHDVQTPSTPAQLRDAAAAPSPVVGSRQAKQPQEANAVPKAPAFLNLRIPVNRLDRMSNLIGELLISYERLVLQQSQLQQTSLALKKQTQQLTPIKDEVRVFYDQLATAGIGSAAAGTGGEGRNSEFDLLAFDQYTSLHSTLQSFQELMVQVQESRTDIDLINRDFQDSLVQVRQQLGGLYQDLTASRLVPFKHLAERFIAPLQGFCQRFHKVVELDIVGPEMMVDQVLLEQLQTPLTHLLRNAFDHGIESPAERLSAGKDPTARITLAAKVLANEVMISIQDDGQGIDLQKVYHRARQLQLCTLERDDVTDGQILELMFAPGFSTAQAVTELSGRGMGLDAVRSQITQLRGRIQVTTQPGQGTTFTITLPLSLNILPLLLCRCQQKTIAIPSPNIREVIALAEYLPEHSDATEIQWQGQTIPLYSLVHWLPYHQQVESMSRMRGKLGVVLEVQGRSVVVAIDALLGERELVLKPFDTTIPVPPYIAGCTVLGTGEVVPVLSPEHLNLLFSDRALSQPQVAIASNSAAGIAVSESPTETSEVAHKILVADDSVAVRRFVGEVLASAGYQVVSCRDGKEALETLERDGETFTMVITDIEMPRLDGLGLLRSIRAHERLAHLPVAMLTSRDNAKHRKLAEDLGADTYFTKPFQPQELLDGVEKLCAAPVEEFFNPIENLMW